MITPMFTPCPVSSVTYSAGVIVNGPINMALCLGIKKEVIVLDNTTNESFYNIIFIMTFNHPVPNTFKWTFTNKQERDDVYDQLCFAI